MYVFVRYDVFIQCNVSVSTVHIVLLRCMCLCDVVHIYTFVCSKCLPRCNADLFGR